MKIITPYEEYNLFLHIKNLKIYFEDKINQYLNIPIPNSNSYEFIGRFLLFQSYKEFNCMSLNGLIKYPFIGEWKQYANKLILQILLKYHIKSKNICNKKRELKSFLDKEIFYLYLNGKDNIINPIKINNIHQEIKNIKTHDQFYTLSFNIINILEYHYMEILKKIYEDIETFLSTYKINSYSNIKLDFSGKVYIDYQDYLVKINKLDDCVKIIYQNDILSLSHRRYQLLKDNYNGDPYKFKQRLYVMLRRYNTFMLNNTKNNLSSMHSAIQPQIYNTFNIKAELFSSPLNFYLNEYYSAFEDTDIYFGSKGSFFDRGFPKEGNYLANPPYELSFMEKTYEQIEKILRISDKTKNLVIILSVPYWKTPKPKFITKCENSQYLDKKILFQKKDHYYIKGNDFSDNNSDKKKFKSPFETAFFIFKNNDSQYNFPDKII